MGCSCISSEPCLVIGGVGGISGKLISPERSCSGEEGRLWDGLFTRLLRNRLFRVSVVG